MGKRRANRQQQQLTQGATALKPISAPNTGTVQTDVEYVAPVAANPLSNQLPAQRRDKHAPEITFETYHRMMADPAVNSSVRTLVRMALADGMQIVPASGGQQINEDALEFARAQELAEGFRRACLSLTKPLAGQLAKLLEGALTYGHKTAEVTWKMGMGMDAGKLVLGRLACKSFDTLDFVIDGYWNHVGFLARNSYGQQPEGNRIIPREKFAVLTLFAEDEDPRGCSAIRPAYTPWLFKTHTWPEFLRWLQNCALPGIVGKTPPSNAADNIRAAQANKTQKTPAQALSDTLVDFKSASVAVVPNGTEIEQIAAGETEGFEGGFQVADTQIARAILGQTLATGEAQFGTRAQSQTHMQVLDLFVAWLKTELAALVSADLLNKWIRYNHGDEALEFAPLITFGDSDRRDWSKDANAASLLHGKVTKTQWLTICTQLGLPTPDEGEEVPGYGEQMEQQSGEPMVDPEQHARVLPFVKRQARTSASFITVGRAA